MENIYVKYGVLTTFPQCNFSLKSPEVLSQTHTCYHWLSVSGISKIMHCAILRSMHYYETESLPPPCHKRLNSSYFYSVTSFCFSLENTCHGTHATLSLSVKLNTVSYNESTAMFAQKYQYTWELFLPLVGVCRVSLTLTCLDWLSVLSVGLGWDGKSSQSQPNPTERT